jgi:lysozyme
MNRDLLASVKQHEGCRLKAYQDTEGVWTIGYGRNIQELEIDREQAEVWLVEDLKKSIKELDRAFQGWRDHSEVRQNVLIEMQFQLGATRLAGFLKFWAALRAKDYKTAAREMLNSRWAKQAPLRVMTLAARMETDSF